MRLCRCHRAGADGGGHSARYWNLGRYNTESEIDYTLEVLPGIIGKLMELSPYEKELKALRMGNRGKG